MVKELKIMCKLRFCQNHQQVQKFNVVLTAS